MCVYVHQLLKLNALREQIQKKMFHIQWCVPSGVSVVQLFTPPAVLKYGRCGNQKQMVSLFYDSKLCIGMWALSFWIQLFTPPAVLKYGRCGNQKQMVSLFYDSKLCIGMWVLSFWIQLFTPPAVGRMGVWEPKNKWRRFEFILRLKIVHWGCCCHSFHSGSTWVATMHHVYKRV